MPEIHNKKIHSFSSEDLNFPAKNLLETRVTKKWKCKEDGERSCFVIFKLDQPRNISGIDIGNEHSGFIEVMVGNSKHATPVFKEILLATSFMTIFEAKNGTNPNRVRCFTKNALVESISKEKWDLVKVLCTQPFNNKLKYGLSFVTLHTPEDVQNDNSPVKIAQSSKPSTKSSEKKNNFGKFSIRPSSDSEDDDKTKKKDTSSPFNRWKSMKDSQDKPSIKEQVKTKIEENRKRIRIMTDSSSDEAPKEKVKPKPSRNRTTGLVYEDEDDEPNEKLQKKLDKDKAAKEKERDAKTPKLLVQREKSPASKSKFLSFIDDDEPKIDKQRSSSSSKSSSNDKKHSSKHLSPSRKHSSPSSKHLTPSKKPSTSRDKKTPDKKYSTENKPPKNVTYKPFNKLLEGVVFAFSGYVNPERGILRQKALDMGAKYRSDWDSSCTHLICAFVSTPKYAQVKGKGKIVTKRWIENCFSDQKKLPWRRYALASDEKDVPESEDEIHNILAKPKELSSKSPAKRKSAIDSEDDDEVVVDKRVKNGNDSKTKENEAEPKMDEVKSKEPELKHKEPELIQKESEPISTEDKPSVMDISTDDEIHEYSDTEPPENQLFKDKVFFLNEDLSATDVIKLKTQITTMSGRVTERASKAGYVITTGKKLPQNILKTTEVLTALWVSECHEIGGLIPTTRYKIKSN